MVQATKRQIPVVGIVVGVVVALVVAAIVFGGGDVASETGNPGVTGEVLPPFVSGQVDPAIGLATPTVIGENFSGDTVEIDTNGPTAIAFLAHWCPHCQAEVVAVQEWLDSGAGVEGVEMMSVATATNSARDNYPPSEWLDNAGWTPDVIVDDTDGSVMDAFGGSAFPFWVFLDAEGDVVARSAGALDLATLEQYLLAAMQ